MPACFGPALDAGNRGGKNQIMAMVVECDMSFLAETFDALASRDRTVDFAQFVEKLAGQADRVKFPHVRRPTKPTDSTLCERKGVWYNADAAWKAAVGRARESLEVKMLV